MLIFREMFRESTDSGDASAVLAAVDAISRATLESTTLEELLPRLLEAFLAHARAAETAVILIREGDRLRVRAVRGFLADEETRRGFSLPVGEGFAGTIAAEGRPRLLADATTDPLVQSDALRRAGVRALYGVPLAESGKVIGVAHMGARATGVFPASDLHLFDAMASRASAGISLHRAREQREEATARLEALFESAPVGLGFWDRDLRFLRVNRRLAETNGLPAEAHVGRTPAELFPRVEGLEAVVARWREILATGRPWIGAELSGETPARPGARRHWRADFFPVRVGGEVAGLGAVVEEVTDERRADAEAALLARASAELEEATDLQARLERAAALAIPAFADFCGVVLLDEGRPRRVRVHAEHPPDAALARELLARRAGDLDADLDAGGGVGRVLREGKSALVEEVGPGFPPAADRSAAAPQDVRRVDGPGLRSYLCVPLRGHRGVLGALAFGMTRSGRRFDARSLAVAEELGRRVGLAIDSARLLEEARAEARLREQVMAIVSHDLRTPLSAILLSARGVGARAAPGADGEPLRRAAETIRRSAARMERLIGDLLDVAAIQRGGLSVSPAPHRPGELVREAVEHLGAAAGERGVELRTEAAPDLPLVLADHDRILQVLQNLVSNAVSVTDEGGYVGVRAENRATFVRFAVQDTGPGVAADERQRIFEPYRRGAGAEYRGTGLGLAIARGIVAAHHGAIGVEARPGGGSVFWFTLPVEKRTGAAA